MITSLFDLLSAHWLPAVIGVVVGQALSRSYLQFRGLPDRVAPILGAPNRYGSLMSVLPDFIEEYDLGTEQHYYDDGVVIGMSDVKIFDEVDDSVVMGAAYVWVYYFDAVEESYIEKHMTFGFVPDGLGSRENFNRRRAGRIARARVMHSAVSEGAALSLSDGAL